jgi:hypothetical protein
VWCQAGSAACVKAQFRWPCSGPKEHTTLTPWSRIILQQAAVTHQFCPNGHENTTNTTTCVFITHVCGIAQSVRRLGYGLVDRREGVRFPISSIDILFSITSRPTLGTHQASYTTGTEDCSPWAKRKEREAVHSPQFSAEIKIGEALLQLMFYGACRQNN